MYIKRLILFCLVLCSACKDRVESSLSTSNTESLILKYAKGFSVDYYDDYKVIHILQPWQGASKEFSYILISEEELAKTSFPKNTYDGIIIDPLDRIVVTSTTHLPALELLEETKALVGFPGTDYISSNTIRQAIAAGNVRDLGQNESLNTEVLIELNPDVIVGFGVDEVNKAFSTAEKAGIPVIYNGDWVESSPLAKAEWLKLFGVLLNKEKQADSIFKRIEKNYIDAMQLAQQTKHSPTILSGAMHNDVWYLPKGSSTEAQLLKDAHTSYIWENTKGEGSLALSYETVLDKAKSADIWLNPSIFSSYTSLKDANQLYTNFEAFASKNIFTIANTKGETGGVLYYELGISRPDLVLKDIIKIAHPNLLPDYNFVFFKPLQQ